MATRGLTDIAIRNMKPRAARYEVPDGKARGLYVVCQPSGKKGFAIRFRFNGATRKLTLASGVTLANARRLAADALHQVELGRDPGAAKREAEQEAQRKAADTLRSVVENFYRRDGARLRTRDAQLATLERHVLSGPLAGRPIATIKRREIVALLDVVADRSGLREGDMVLAHLRRVMNWHAARDDDFVSPVVRGMARLKPSDYARSRVLSDAELRAVVTTARELRTPFALFVLYLLFTAARRREASHMQWDELTNDGGWLLPAARNKTKQDLLRPLSGAARDVLAVAQQIEGCSFAFSNDGTHALSSYSKFKKQFDAACGVTDWRLHDLRRTARSLMSRAGVNSDVAERCLGHVIPGVRGIYDRHHYSEEMGLAYERLAQLIERIANPPQANVVDLAARALI
jgi:integrase